MPRQVVNGARLVCSFGSSPGKMTVLPLNRTTSGDQPHAVITDILPFLNIPAFGLCSSLLNPVVAAATVAKLGVMTPQPCIPAPAAPWVPGTANVQIGNIPALDDTSSCMCLWAGKISIADPGQSKTDIP